MTYILIDGPCLYGALTVGTSAIELKVGASPLAERKVVTAQPLSGEIFWGFDSSVTVTTGKKIFRGQDWSKEMGPTQSVFLIAATSINVRITEES